MRAKSSSSKWKTFGPAVSKGCLCEVHHEESFFTYIYQFLYNYTGKQFDEEVKFYVSLLKSNKLWHTFCWMLLVAQPENEPQTRQLFHQHGLIDVILIDFWQQWSSMSQRTALIELLEFITVFLCHSMGPVDNEVSFCCWEAIDPLNRCWCAWARMQNWKQSHPS